MLSPTHSRSRQHGISLLESLTAILVMALGILGILGVQMRTLADTQTGIRRAQAIRLTEDLSERIKVNPSGLGTVSNYAVDWGDVPGTIPDCSAGCSPSDLSLYQIDQWKKSVKDTLPLGDARVFIPADETDANNLRQIGVMISWRENERARESDSTTDNAAYKSIFNTTGTGVGNVSITCPSGSICHLQYIQPTARCAPYSLAGPGSTQVFCP